MRSILIPVTICSLLVTGKIHAQSNTVCTTTTVGQLSLQTNTKLFDSILETAGAGIAVIVLGKGKPLARAGAVIVLLKPLKDLITTFDQKLQLDSRPDWKSSTNIQVCGDDSLISTLGFRDLKPLPKLKLEDFDVAAPRLWIPKMPLGYYLNPQK